MSYKPRVWIKIFPRDRGVSVIKDMIQEHLLTIVDTQTSWTCVKRTLFFVKVIFRDIEAFDLEDTVFPVEGVSSLTSVLEQVGF